MVISGHEAIRKRNLSLESTLLSGVATTGAGTTVLCLDKTDICVQFVSTGTTSISDSIQLEGSLDGTSFSVLAMNNSANTVATAVTVITDTPQLWTIVNAPCIKYIRATVGTHTTGSLITVKLTGR